MFNAMVRGPWPLGLLALLPWLPGAAQASEPQPAPAKPCHLALVSSCQGLNQPPPALADLATRLVRTAGLEPVAPAAPAEVEVSLALRGLLVSESTGPYEDTGEMHLMVRADMEGELTVNAAGASKARVLRGTCTMHSASSDRKALLASAYEGALHATGLARHLGELLLPDEAQRLACYVRVLASERDVQTTRAVLEGLSPLKERSPAVPALIEVYRRSAFLQPEVGELLGRIGGEAVTAFFLEALRGQDSAAADNAAVALEDNRDPRVAPALVAALLAEDRDAVRRAVRSQGLSAEAPLLEALRRPEAQVRDRAAWALGQIHSLLAVEPLLARLTSGDEPSFPLVNALGELQDARAIAPLRELAQRGGQLGRLALLVLGQLEAWEAVDLLLEGAAAEESDWARKGLQALSGEGEDYDVPRWKAWWAATRARPARVEPAPLETLALDLGRPGAPVPMQLVRIPAGTFTRGGGLDAGWLANGPAHAVRLSKPYFLGRTEVTQAQFEALMGTNPSRFKSLDLPVHDVAFREASEFCVRLSTRTGKRVRLPTEAEWERACRGGTDAPVFYARERRTDFAWFAGNALERPHPVGAKRPNPYGLFDVYGNVAEWCADWSGDYPQDPVTDPSGPASGDLRIVRGGAFDTLLLRSVLREADLPEERAARLGFRVLVEAE